MSDARSFRKKPVVIQAIQWDGTLSGIDDILSVFTDIRTVAKTSHQPTNKCSYWRIGTLEGGHEVSAGDFIIRGVKGEYYPCKPDVFAMTYDPEPAALRAQPAVPEDVAMDAARYRFLRSIAYSGRNRIGELLWCLRGLYDTNSYSFDEAIDDAMLSASQRKEE